MYVVYINLLYFCRFFCLLTIKIFFPKKIISLVSNISHMIHVCTIDLLKVAQDELWIKYNQLYSNFTSLAGLY